MNSKERGINNIQPPGTRPCANVVWRFRRILVKSQKIIFTSMIRSSGSDFTMISAEYQLSLKVPLNCRGRMQHM